MSKAKKFAIIVVIWLSLLTAFTGLLFWGFQRELTEIVDEINVYHEIRDQQGRQDILRTLEKISSLSE